MKLTPLIGIGEFKPDLTDYANDGLLTCKNVIPDSGRYKPFPSLLAYSTAATTRVRGGLAYQHTDQGIHIFAGDNTKLYKTTGATLSDASRTSGGAYNCIEESQWEFLNYGSRVIATDGTDVIQSYVVGTDTNFSALSSTAPKAKTMAVVNNFLMLGNVEDTSYSLGNMPDAVWL